MNEFDLKHAAWVAAIKALAEHEDECSGCQVDHFCDDGTRLAGIEIRAHWALTHPEVQP